MVTSQKMTENEMGYRGSKSGQSNTAMLDFLVKEQRVDGSWFLKRAVPNRNLRCTLMDFERNYQVKIPAKQFISRMYSTLLNKTMLDP